MTDFSITTTVPEEAPTARKIVISGGMTIHHAIEIRTAMLEALTEADEVQLDLAEVAEIDLIGLQLICSSHRTASTDNKLFRVSGGDDAIVKSAADAGGFLRHIGCAQDVNHTCVWSGGGR